MKIELRKVAYYPRMSEETAAFNADVYVDGVKRGTAENDGKGGANFVHPRTLSEEIEAYARTLPPREADGRMIPVSGDYLISDILADHLNEKDLKKLLKRKTVFLRDGKCYEMKAPHRPTGAVTILNDLPIEEALKLFKAIAG